jgi:dUTP pyrophosphatase
VKPVLITRIDPELPMPSYTTAGSVGFDLYARETTRIASGALARIPANVIVAVPEGFTLLVALRSSTPMKTNLMCPNGVGIIDRDYCGPDDEIKVQVYNFGPSDAIVSRGDRIAQALFVKSESLPIVEAAVSRTCSRGGFGSTG